MSESIVPSFAQAIEQFNQREFYACHDTLEAIWNDALQPDKNFYQGVLQIAVGLYHLGNKNWHGATILLGEGIGRLRYYQPGYEGIDVTQLMRESAKLLAILQQTRAEGIDRLLQSIESDGRSLPRIERLPP